MTTFIDFRYSAAQAGAIHQIHGKSEEFLALESDSEGYVALEIAECSAPGILASIGNLELLLENNGDVYLRIGNTRVAAASGSWVGKKEICAIRFGPGAIGIKAFGVVSEGSAGSDAWREAGGIVLTDYARILGADSDRAASWARIFYHRKKPQGLNLEVIMDWQNVQTGIPTNAMSTVEELLSQSDFNIKFTSYASSPERARNSDFYRLFSSAVDPQITLHIAPPIYTSANPSTVNIGLFVVESNNVAAAVIARSNQMDALIVPSQFVKTVLRDCGVTCPMHVIPHGVDLDAFKPVENKSPLPGGKRFNILSVAAYSERKNIRQLAHAFMEEFKISEDIALHLYIRPEYLTTQHNLLLEVERWEAWYFHEGASVLLSTSYVPRSKLSELYANADVYLMPSNEGFGFTLLEAMACGTPVIGLGYGGQTDFLNSETGYVVAPAKKSVCTNMDLLPLVGDTFYSPNHLQLRKTLRHAFNHPEELLQRGRQARKYVEPRFTWNEVGKQIKAVIQATFDGRQKLAPLAEHKPPILTWMVGVVDDAGVAPAFSKVRPERRLGREVICLFTRHGRVRDALTARRNGFLLYRWDATLENFRSLAFQLAKSDWVGLIYADEKFSGSTEELIKFLAAQSFDVTEVKVMVDGESFESRFFRPRSVAETGNTVEFDGFKIRGVTKYREAAD